MKLYPEERRKTKKDKKMKRMYKAYKKGGKYRSTDVTEWAKED